MKRDAAKYAPNGTAGLLSDAYLQEVNRYPRLSLEEEIELAYQFRNNGDQEAAHKLVTSNLRLVLNIAKKYKNLSVAFPELIQEGSHGLMKAVGRFDPARGTLPRTYASAWVKSAMLRFITAQRNWSDFLNALVKVGSDEQFQDLQPSPLQGYTLEDPLESDGFEAFHQQLDQFRQTIDARELGILDSRILVDKPGTLQGIAERHGVSRGRVRQLENRLIKKLKHDLRRESSS